MPATRQMPGRAPYRTAAGIREVVAGTSWAPLAGMIGPMIMVTSVILGMLISLMMPGMIGLILNFVRQGWANGDVGGAHGCDGHHHDSAQRPRADDDGRGGVPGPGGSGCAGLIWTRLAAGHSLPTNGCSGSYFLSARTSGTGKLEIPLKNHTADANLLVPEVRDS